jgi:hypothetical protein
LEIRSTLIIGKKQKKNFVGGNDDGGNEMEIELLPFYLMQMLSISENL